MQQRPDNPPDVLWATHEMVTEKNWLLNTTEKQDGVFLYQIYFEETYSGSTRTDT